MKPNQPEIIQRTQTVIVEAAEKQSRNHGVGSYETIMNQGVEINNGDVISLESAFVDTSNIDPNNIFLPEDVVITWNNGLYIINQQLETLGPCSRRGNSDTITDNLPLVLCQFQPSSVGEMVLWGAVTSKRSVGLAFPKWGDVDIRFIVQDQNGASSIVTKRVPPFGNVATGTWDLDIVSNKNFPPIPIDPTTGKAVGPANYAFSNPPDVGNIFVPILAYQGVNPLPPNIIPSIPVDDGQFYPVINDGSFTILAGSYEPSHMAKILTDGFDRLNTDRDFQNPVPKNRNFPYGKSSPFLDSDVTPDPTLPANTEYLVNLGNFDQLPVAWSQSALLGWNATFTYRTLNTAPPATPPVPIAHETVKIIASKLTDPVGHFRIGPLKIPPPTAPVYPSNGAMTLVLTSPDGYFDTGSAFLQSSENYKINGVDGQPMFAMVDCENNNNVFTFKETESSWIGSNNVEVSWDADQKRFRFNYMHFPLTSGPSTGPAIINQLTYNLNTLTSTYDRAYAAGSRNISSTAYGGIFFTSLEPFTSFWQKILGFDSSLLVQQAAPSAALAFDDGISPAPISGITPGDYPSAKLPNIKLKTGLNITEQLFVLGDLTGRPADYTGVGYQTYSATATPSDGGTNPPTGRVAVSADDVVPIIAGRGEALGQQTSGYYVVDIDIGTSYNQNIGSDKTQLSYSRNMRGIIDRYYSANSYTSSQGTDISYIHYGNSFQLQSLKIRISNSDGSIIEDLGSDNTVFIKVIKNNQINLAPTPLPAPQE